jgi:ubiquinone/menaquinone biosynthesis C-methylase UbiE
MTESATARYAMGYDDRERRRLQLQASIINPVTEQLLRRAGLGVGMRVLDVGAGVGDVAMLAARIVGTAGSVTACDLDETALAVLRERAESEGLTNISTLAGDLHALALPHDIDAVIGRHILIHVPDPLEIVRLVSGFVRPGGVVVFQEYDFSVMHAGFPPTPLRDRTFEVFRDFFAMARHGNMGTRLPVLFAAAGLTDIDARAEYPVGPGVAESPYYEWFAESLRSILARAVAAGVPGARDVEIDTLEERLRAEGVASGAVAPAPTMVGAVGRRALRGLPNVSR